MGLEGPTYVGDRRVAADGGHVSFVKVVEFVSWLARHVLGDFPRGMTAHLHGRLRYAWNLTSVFFDMGQITADKNLRVAGRVQVDVDDGATAPIRWHAQHFAQG